MLGRNSSSLSRREKSMHTKRIRQLRHSLSILPNVDESARSFTSVVRFKKSEREGTLSLFFSHFVFLQCVVLFFKRVAGFLLLAEDAKKEND